MDRLDLVLRPGADARELSADALKLLYDACRAEVWAMLHSDRPHTGALVVLAHGMAVTFTRGHQRLGSGYHTELWIGEYDEVLAGSLS